MKQQKTLIVHLNLSRRAFSMLALVVFLVALLGYQVLGQEKTAAASSQTFTISSTGPRWFYLTDTWHDGEDTLAACASGYHMASLWEIMDVTNLRYNVDLGIKRSDSGMGVPSHAFGWVRTGYNGDDVSTPGMANCNVWTNDDLGDYGTAAALPSDWTGSDSGDVHVWDVMVDECADSNLVWCVED